MARSFNGSSGVINASSIAATGSQSQACWVYFNSVAARADFFSHWSNLGAVNFAWLLSMVGASFNFFYFLSDNGANASGVDSTVHPSAATWYHVCGTWDGTNQRIYVNGVLKASATPAYASIFNSSATIRMGAGVEHPTATTYYLNGSVAEAAMWNAALSQGEVSSLAAGYSPILIRPENLQAYWPLIGRTSPEIDLIGANGGTLTGTAAAPHPRIIMPNPPNSRKFVTAAFKAAWARGTNLPVLGTGNY